MPQRPLPKSPPPRARMVDIAQHAGVSTATVDRALNQRPNVRNATVHRLVSAPGVLGCLPQADLYARLKPAPLQLAFVLPAGTNRYVRMLADSIEFSQDHLTPF